MVSKLRTTRGKHKITDNNNICKADINSILNELTRKNFITLRVNGDYSVTNLTKKALELPEEHTFFYMLLGCKRSECLQLNHQYLFNYDIGYNIYINLTKRIANEDINSVGCHFGWGVLHGTIVITLSNGWRNINEVHKIIEK